MNQRYSIIPAAAVVDKRLTHLDVRILANLGMHTDRNGWCFKNQSKIAAELGCLRQTVCEAIRRLRECGYVESRDINTDKPIKGLRSINCYRILMDSKLPPETSTVEAMAEDNGDAAKPAESDTAKISPLSPQDDNRCHPTPTTVVGASRQLNDPRGTVPVERYKSSSSLPVPKLKTNTPRKRQPDLPGIGNQKEDPCEQFKTAYNEVAKKVGLREIKMTSGRRVLIRQIINMPSADKEALGITDWRDIIAKIENSVFPTKWGWVPEFQHIMSEKHLTSLMEGRFDNPRIVAMEKAIYERYRSCMDIYCKTRGIRWPDNVGPKPGLPGCTVPEELLKAFPEALEFTKANGAKSPQDGERR